MIRSVHQLTFPFAADWAMPGYAYHRALIGYVLEELEMLADAPGPKFVFAHIVAPHPPFVVSSTGQARSPDRPFDASDGDQFQGSQAEYVQGYGDQVIYLNSRLLPLVHRIIEASRGGAVIILQGDHGPGGGSSGPSHHQKPYGNGVGFSMPFTLRVATSCPCIQRSPRLIPSVY